MTRMSNELADRCRAVILRYSGVDASREKFFELMDKDPDLETDLIEFDSPSDTADRERLLDAIAMDITGRYWPAIYEGCAVMEQFSRDLRDKVQIKGYNNVR